MKLGPARGQMPPCESKREIQNVNFNSKNSLEVKDVRLSLASFSFRRGSILTSNPMPFHTHTHAHTHSGSCLEVSKSQTQLCLCAAVPLKARVILLLCKCQLLTAALTAPE